MMGKGPETKEANLQSGALTCEYFFNLFISVHCRNWSSPKPHLLSVQVATHILSWHSNLRKECQSGLC